MLAIISNDVPVAVPLAGKRQRDFRFLHHRTHIAENGKDFCALRNSLVALVAIVVIAVAFLGSGATWLSLDGGGRKSDGQSDRHTRRVKMQDSPNRRA